MTVEKTVEIPQLQIVEKIVEIPEIQTVQGTQTSESLGTAPVRQVAPAEIVEVVELERPFPQNPHPLFVKAPVSESPAVVMEQVQPAPVVEYENLAPVVMYATSSDHFDSDTNSFPNCNSADRHTDGPLHKDV